ncbi:MAG: 4-hydroxythreonine-4-phosphate dehydrogenase PdxA [Marinilabiliales bacterium]|nr:MAG: 4-hydroxythreonine-4-phosphate dehydrogenase PdxA [Marinilabiliales bacterium]
MSDKIKIGITHGDINGIGYEIIIKSLIDNRLYESFIPIVYGSPKAAAYHRKALNIPNFSLNSINSADDANPKRANIIDCCEENIRVELGKSTKHGGSCAFNAIETAVKDLKEGKIDILVTCPINKHNIQSESFNFPGHTEYLQEMLEGEESLMLMVSDILKVGVVTGHIPVSEVPSKITEEKILSKLRLLNQTLKKDFAIRKPKIAVLGLNPHAGDNGFIGKEEKNIIEPAIKKASDEGIIALGPYPADGLFGSSSLNKYDAILAMYHDQGLTPFKALCFDTGVNFTAGLKAIRTSPAHGTAFEIAGQNIASEESFRNAIYLALDVYRNRFSYNKLTKNPLKNFETDSE